MTDLPTGSSKDRRPTLVWWSLYLGGVLTTVGVVVGFAMVFGQSERALEGTAIIVFALMFGILIALTGMIAKASLTSDQD